jgi:hypothetical protein
MLRPRNEDVSATAGPCAANPASSVLLLPVGWGIKISRFEP